MAKREFAEEFADPRKAARRSAAVAEPSAPPPRLVLVLDIDNTLVHSAPISATVHPQLQALAADVIRFRVPPEPSTGGVELDYKVKLRAGLAEFLEAAHEHYDLAVYTHGSDAYAKEILRLIDPVGIYFGGRVVSRMDGENLKRLVLLLGEDRLEHAVVIDDREDVWEDEAKPVLQLVRPFHFFEKAGLTGPLMPGLPARFAKQHVLADPANDEQLNLTLTSTLSKVRDEMALLGPGAKVREAMKNVRKRVLEGVVVVFAGGLIETELEVEASPLWRFAEVRAPAGLCATPGTPSIANRHLINIVNIGDLSLPSPTLPHIQALGASCLRDFDVEAVTHVVSGTAESKSVSTALSSERRINVVNPGWLLDSWYRTARVAEGAYPLERMPAQPPGAPNGGAPQQMLEPSAAPDANGAGSHVEPASDPRLSARTADPRLAADPRLVGDPRIAAVTRGMDARVDPRIHPRTHPSFAADESAVPRSSSIGGAPPPASGAQVAPQQAAPSRLADPRRRRAPLPPPGRPAKSEPPQPTAQPRIDLPPPAMPLHVLEAELDSKLRSCVKQPELEILMNNVRLVRNPREPQNVRELSLSRIVEMVGKEKIEAILDALGFYKPPPGEAAAINDDKR